MKLSEIWLREWVNPQAPIDDIAERLIMGGLELEVEPVVSPLPQGVVVGQILSASPHPQADRLQVCEVDIGQAMPLTIVCGAANARAGIRVPCATVGATLPSGMAITQATLRGVESAGMLCSAKELGLSEHSDGLLELDANTPIGQPIVETLTLSDNILNLEITPNRGDCLSIQGLARDVAALFGVQVKRTPPPAVVVVGAQTLKVEVIDTHACPTYAGRVISRLNPKAHTPDWMRQRLLRSGLRCIHPLVDVTNYVMLELGQPLHAFDTDKIKGSIHVRPAHEGEKLTVLTGEQLTLRAQELVIADDTAAIALAGVMGGADSGVGVDTTSIFLESACFAPAAVAGTARRHKLSSDAAFRFERGVDPALQRTALDRATQLILDICGGEVHPVSQAGRHSPEPIQVRLRHARLKQLLGHDISARDVEHLLARLGITTRNEIGDAWLCKIPSYRYDLRLEVDLIEEVARLYGYDRIPARPYQAALAPSQPTETQRNLSHIRQTLIARGWQETVSLAFIDAAQHAVLDPQTPAIAVDNPIAETQSLMRTTLWPGLINAWQHNRQRQIDYQRLFETAVCFTQNNGTITETTRIAGLASGPATPEQWGVPARAVDFYDLKAEVCALFGAAAEQYRFEPAIHPALHPGRCARILRGKTFAGWIGELHPSATHALDLSSAPLLFELDWHTLRDIAIPTTSALSEFPSSRRDLALVVDAGISAQQILDCVHSNADPRLKKAIIFDVYLGERLENNKKSIALGLIFNDPSHTLKLEEIDAATTAVTAALHRDLAATLR